MEQEPMLNVSPEPDKASDSKNFLIAIIIILAIALVGLGALFLYNTSKNSPVENEMEKNGATSNNTVANDNTSPSVTEKTSATSTTTTTTETTVTPAEVKKADLYVKSYTLSESPKVGSEFTATIVIGNKGQATSAESYWEWWSTSSKQSCKKKVGAISAGGASTVKCDHTYTSWDDYTTKAIVDSQNDVDESNESNNITTKEVTPKHDKADLTITKYEFNHDPVMGEEFKVKITIKNKGETDAEDFKWEWWSTHASSSCDGEVNKLEAGDSIEVSCEYTYASWSTYATKAIVDSDDDVNEEEEDNNTSTKNVIPIH
ncbi:MAG TPA: CARDB domain-containing protein [Candidatus Moranbacteria bacterium]|nr:CARDB domain-containing protein [Candidatus Moranbacteria bacterium]